MARRKPAPPKLPEPSEDQIHFAVVSHLRTRAREDVVFWHTPNQGIRTKAGAAKLKAMGLTPGVPDLVIYAEGQLYALELKTTKGRLSRAQDDMLKALRHAGAHAVAAFGLDSALQYLTAWGIFASKPPAALRAVA
jgi:hypothetical protein